MEEIRIAREAAKAAEEQRLAAIRAAEEAESRAKLAGLPSGGDKRRFPDNLADDPVALARALLSELKRVGCYDGDAEGTWGTKAQGALEQFLRLSKANIPLGPPSKAALQAVSDHSEHVCPQPDSGKEGARRSGKRTVHNSGSGGNETHFERSGRSGGRGWVGRAIRSGRGE